MNIIFIYPREMDGYVSAFNLEAFGELGRFRWNQFMFAIGNTRDCEIEDFPPTDIFGIRHQFLKSIHDKSLNTRYYKRFRRYLPPQIYDSGDFYAFVLDAMKDNGYIDEDIIRDMMRKEFNASWMINYNKILSYCSDETMDQWIKYNKYNMGKNFLECVKHGKIECFKRRYSEVLPTAIECIKNFDSSSFKGGYEKITVGEIYEALINLSTPKPPAPQHFVI